MPYVQTAMALQATPGGDAIIQKLQKGEPLTATQEKKLEKAQETAAAAGVSEERIGQMLETAAQNFERRMWEADKAKDAMRDLNAWAGKKYPGYEELHKTPQWKEKLGTILDAIKNETLLVPDGEDPYEFAVDQSYGWLKGLDPDIGKEKPSKKSENERRAAISQSSVQAGGVAPEDSDNLPDYANVAIAPRGATGGGRSFGSLKRT